MERKQAAELYAVELSTVRHTDLCICGHARADHVFSSGLCVRNAPGLHSHDCEWFKQDSLDKILTAIQQAAKRGEE